MKLSKLFDKLRNYVCTNLRIGEQLLAAVCMYVLGDICADITKLIPDTVIGIIISIILLIVEAAFMFVGVCIFMCFISSLDKFHDKVNKTQSDLNDTDDIDFEEGQSILDCIVDETNLSELKDGKYYSILIWVNSFKAAKRLYELFNEQGYTRSDGTPYDLNNMVEDFDKFRNYGYLLNQGSSIVFNSLEELINDDPFKYKILYFSETKTSDSDGFILYRVN